MVDRPSWILLTRRFVMGFPTVVYREAKALVLRAWTARVVIAFEFSVVLALTVVSLRDFIFGDGYYQYADQKWPLSQALLPFGLVGNGGFNYHTGAFDTFGFTRLIVDWPYFILNGVAPTSIVSEKLFVVYLFVVLLVSAYLLMGKVVTVTVRLLRTSLSTLEREGLKLTGVFFAFANLTMINLNADLSAGTDSLIILMLGLVLLTVVSESSPVRIGVVSGLATAITALLDPDYVFAVALVLVLALLLKRWPIRGPQQTVKAIGVAISVALPALIFVTLLVRASQPTYPDVLYRSLSLPTLQYESRFLTPLNSVQLLGYEWSLVSFAPPSILTTTASIPALPYAYDQVLLPSGLTTQAWLASLLAPLALSASTLLSRRLRPLALPAMIVVPLCVVLTQYAQNPPLYALVLGSSNIPLIGPDLAESFSLSSHFLTLIAAMYVILYPSPPRPDT